MLRDCPASQTRKLSRKATTLIEKQFVFVRELKFEGLL